MILQKLKVDNWKHFDTEKEIEFKPGANILSGPNFIGKSSILEAIQYAISGKFPSSKSDSNKMWIHKDTFHFPNRIIFQALKKRFLSEKID